MQQSKTEADSKASKRVRCSKARGQRGQEVKSCKCSKVQTK